MKGPSLSNSARLSGNWRKKPGERVRRRLKGWHKKKP